MHFSSVVIPALGRNPSLDILKKLQRRFPTRLYSLSGMTGFVALDPAIGVAG